MGLARYYLGPKHRDRLAESCPFSAIGAQAGRAPEPFRKAYEQELKKSLNAIGGAPTDAAQEHDRYDEAIALMAVCVGGLTLSRAVADPAFSDRILKVAQDAAAALAERAEQAA
jgi:TetR/AcrR family transcriptional repressor of nem operon